MTENLKQRKPTRLKGYDYSATGAYFITICTKGKKQILPRIVGDGVLDVPKNILTSYGKIADNYINQMDVFYNNVSVDKYIIMPNHIHLLLIVAENNGTPRTPSPTNSVVSKFVGTFKRFCNKDYGENIWQRSFNDHIIRGENDYLKIWEYINSNTLK